jgi:hypothetical protein
MHCIIKWIQQQQQQHQQGGAAGEAEALCPFCRRPWELRD